MKNPRKCVGCSKMVTDYWSRGITGHGGVHNVLCKDCDPYDTGYTRAERDQVRAKGIKLYTLNGKPNLEHDFSNGVRGKYFERYVEFIVDSLLEAEFTSGASFAGKSIKKTVNLRNRISGAVWDFLLVFDGYVAFVKETGEHTSLLPVPSNVHLSI